MKMEAFVMPSKFISRTYSQLLRYFLVLSFPLIVLFQNCDGFKALQNKSLSTVAFGSNGGSDLQPSSDKLDANCSRDTSYDVCIFYKNPVAQIQTPLPQLMNNNLDFSSLQIYGVKLTGLKNTGFLENDKFQILTLNVPRLSTNNPFGLKVGILADSQFTIPQMMTYYWLERTAEYLEARLGRLASSTGLLKVYVDDSIAGFSSASQSIHLTKTDAGNKMALSGDLAIYYYGVANAWSASAGLITKNITRNHIDCNSRSLECCTTSMGCAKALQSAAGDYFVHLMFPDRLGLGEAWINNASGIGYCGVNRNLSLNQKLSADQAYAACAAQSANGEVHVMGSLYASIWWNIRSNAESLKSGSSQEIDSLFIQHLALLTADDDFKSVQAKIQSVDNRLFAGAHKAAITAEFVARGL
jgi:hypothetical protein